MQLTRVEIRKAFQLAYYLHPHREVALEITQSALFDWLPVLQKGQQKRQQQRGLLARLSRKKILQPYKRVLPSAGLIQASVYQISETWEGDQERHTYAIKGNCYRPTADDLLVRYVKLLVARTMERQVVYSALALGCQLYQYSPTQISHLAPQLFEEDNIRRVHRALLGWIAQRFPELSIEQRPPYGEKKVHTRPPLPDERSLILDALEMCAPWWSPCLKSSESILDLFDPPLAQRGQAPSDAEKRLHALIDPTCAGLERLIRAYNRKRGTMPFEEPHNRLEVPAFQPAAPQAPSGHERNNPEALPDETLAVMQRQLARHQQRRRRYQPGPLYVRVDGTLQAQLHSYDAVCPPFHVPLSASYLEVYGQDEAGALLLAVFPLATLEAAEDASWVLSVTHAGGHTIALRPVSDCTETVEGVAGWLVQLTYVRTSPLMTRLWASWGGYWQRLDTRLQELFAHRGVSVCATGVLLLLLLSTGWFGFIALHLWSQPLPDRWRSSPPFTARILLEFQADSAEYEIRTLLQSIGGRIVDGPSAEGRYIVEVSQRVAEPAALDNVMNVLRQRPDVLRFVEPLKGKP